MPVAGILDIRDNYGFVRTSGYLPGPNDVYVSLNQVRKAGLRKGDAITGAVKQQRDGGDPGPATAATSSTPSSASTPSTATPPTRPGRGSTSRS